GKAVHQAEDRVRCMHVVILPAIAWRMNKLPIVYIRGYGGPTAQINTVAEDPFYGFNSGSPHSRVAGDGAPAFYQFEGPLIQLVSDRATTPMPMAASSV